MHRRLAVVVEVAFAVIGGLAFVMRDAHSPTRGSFGPAQASSATSEPGKVWTVTPPTVQGETCAEAAARLGQPLPDPNATKCVFRVQLNAFDAVRTHVATSAAVRLRHTEHAPA